MREIWYDFFPFFFFSEIFYLATHMYGSTITLLIQIHLAWQLRYKLHTLARKHVINQGKCWKDDKELPLRRGKTTWFPLRPLKIFLLRAFGRPQLLNVIHKNSSTQIFFFVFNVDCMGHQLTLVAVFNTCWVVKVWLTFWQVLSEKTKERVIVDSNCWFSTIYHVFRNGTRLDHTWTLFRQNTLPIRLRWWRSPL